MARKTNTLPPNYKAVKPNSGPTVTPRGPQHFSSDGAGHNSGFGKSNYPGLTGEGRRRPIPSRFPSGPRTPKG